MATTRAAATPRAFSGLVCLRAIEFASPDGAFVRARGTTDGDDDVVLVGDLGHVLPGELARVDGRWDTHPQHGEQLRVDRAGAVRLDDHDTVRRFVATTAGVGRAAADALAGAAPPPERSRGPSLFDQAEPDPPGDSERASPSGATPEALLARVDADPSGAFRGAGVPRARIGAAAADWKERRRTHALRALLSAHGLDRVVAHVARALGPTAAARVRDDPHLLCERFGVPLPVADALADTTGRPAAPERRAQAAIVLVLRAATADGHTALPTYLVLGRAARLAGDGAGSAAALDDRVALADLRARGLVAVEPGRVQLRLLAEQEARVARWLHALAGRPGTLATGAKGGRAARPGAYLTAEQLEAVDHVFARRLTIVTGGPGTGKTTLVREVAALAAARRVSLELCAPTGKAAQRLAHATGRPAATIHRLAGRRVDDDETPVDLTAPVDPRLAEIEPRECEVLVCDEASMLTLELATMLMALLPDGAHLVLIGDPDQLPPVGPGAVLADAVASGALPVDRLTEVKRQGAGSHIVRAAREVLAGTLPGPAPAEAGDARDFFVREVGSPGEARAVAADFAGGRLASWLGVDPLRGVQVLTATNQDVDALNAALRPRLNPRGAPAAGGLHVGDKVLSIANEPEAGLVNGALFVVEEHDAGRRRLVVRRDDDGKVLTLEPRHARLLRPAYALTIHKAQGSEFPGVIVLVHAGHGRLLSRTTLYTAITRAQRACLLVAEPDALARTLHRVHAGRRHTALAEALGRRAEAAGAGGAAPG